MSDTQYDVAVIGAGPGGYVAAIRAAQLGLKVALVEKEHLGGVCLNWGCIPTKALLRNAEVISLLGQGKEFGFSVSGFEADFAAAVDRSRKISERLVKGVVIVATGGRARSIPGIAPDGERVLTFREAIVLRQLPASVVVVGAGPIGMEFAHVWGTYGAQVTVVEMLPRALPLEDEEVSAVVERAFKRRKVKVLTATRVQGLESKAGGVEVASGPCPHRHRGTAQQRWTGSGGGRGAGGEGRRRGGRLDAHQCA
jgi:dihydrolipoamide dehydrogenase